MLWLSTQGNTVMVTPFRYRRRASTVSSLCRGMLRSRSWQAPLTLHIYSIDAINVVPCVAEFRVCEV
eukprot:COSAG06_NODE_13723_length_1225_cov_1.377442_1_plen_66_part_10